MDQAAAARYENTLFTTTEPNDQIHRCVVVLDRKHAISFQHGGHSSFKKGDWLFLYNVKSPDLVIKVAVSVTSIENDFIIFKTVDREFEHYPYGSYSMYCGQKYLQLGLNQKREPTWKDGIISKRCVGYYLGTSHGERRDSGSGIFNMNGYFIGLSVAKKDFKFNHLQISAARIGIDYEEVADHHPESKIIPADGVCMYLDVDDPDFPRLEEKPAA